MTAVFADTVYFLALVNRKDQAHQKSVAFSRGTDRPLVTTEWVLMEVGDALCRGKDRAVFQLLLDDLAQSVLSVGILGVGHPFAIRYEMRLDIVGRSILFEEILSTGRFAGLRPPMYLQFQSTHQGWWSKID